MGRSPWGVAMGVSGDAQTHAGQPAGQVPDEVGVTQSGYSSTGPPYASQQSWSEAQHCMPQHAPFVQPVVAHAGVPQVPP